MEGAGSKRKPTAQLTKDTVEGEGPLADAAAEPDASLDLKEADANTLKNRRRLKIVRSHGPVPSGASEPQPTPEKKQEAKPETTETAPEAKEVPCAPADQQAAPPSAETAKLAVEGDSSSATAAAPAAAATANGGAAPDSSKSNTSSGGGLFGSVLKGTPAFVSPFGSLGAAGSSFLLPSGGSSLFGGPPGGPSGAPAAEAEDAEAPPPEEPTVVATTVDSKEEVIFTDRDCRMQCFDVENKAWAPKPPLDGKVDFVVPKKGEEEGLPSARILFFMNRTGRLRLNSPVLPSSVKFRHPVERAAVSAGAKAASAGAATASDGDSKEKKEMPLKMNTVEFTGLKVDAKDSKDTTFYRIRFSSDERAAEFMSLANAKQEEAAKASLNGTTK